MLVASFELAEQVANELEGIGSALSAIPKIQDAGELAKILRLHVNSVREDKERTDKLIQQVQSMADEKEALARQLDVMQEIQETTKRDMDKVGG